MWKHRNRHCFFSKIAFSPNKVVLHLLIIINIFISEEYISLDKEIQIIVNNVKKVIKNDNSRKIYRENKKDGITLIEIKLSDNINFNSFIEIEYDNIQENLENIYKNKLVYLIKSPYEKKPELFEKKILNISNSKILKYLIYILKKKYLLAPQL